MSHPWALTLYANNVTDERLATDIFSGNYPQYTGISFSGFDNTETPIQPRSYGIRWSQRF